MEAHIRKDWQAIILDMKDRAWWSYNIIARELGVNAMTVWQWGKGNATPRPYLQDKIMKLYNRVKRETEDYWEKSQ